MNHPHRGSLLSCSGGLWPGRTAEKENRLAGGHCYLPGMVFFPKQPGLVSQHSSETGNRSLFPVQSVCLAAALTAAEPVTLERVGLFAEGVAVRRIGEETFQPTKNIVYTMAM